MSERKLNAMRNGRDGLDRQDGQDGRKEKFTPRPWYRTKREPIRYDYYGKPCQFSRIEIIDTPDGKYKPRHVIAQVTYANGKGEANADLLTVAPEMYDLLDKCESCIGHLLYGTVDDPVASEAENTIHEIRELLKKARGEE